MLGAEACLRSDDAQVQNVLLQTMQGWATDAKGVTVTLHERSREVFFKTAEGQAHPRSSLP